MANKPRISIALNHIRTRLLKHQPHIYSEGGLHLIFQKGKKKWNLPVAMNYRKFIAALIKEEILGWCHFDFGTEWHEGYYLTISPDYYVVCQLIPNSYISHATALKIWGMGDNKEDKIYINREQSKTLSKSIKGKLVQTGIDTAFKSPQRQTASVTLFQGKEVIFIKGKFSDQLGVIDLDLKGKEQIRITDLERTLIDCVVRPAYGVQPAYMIEAFKKAKNLICITKLADYLNELDYTYPYHQAIGFYLEKAGNYTKSEVDLFLSKGTEHDFYLTYGMTSTAYSKKWSLYIPTNLE
ncbi:MAG: type IV toxin-antitoxin system AbiEi family antitoxin domain-containing protein [Daejeonella sp.]